MKYSDIQELFQESATVKLVRSDHAPVILAFFLDAFRTKNCLIISEADLVEQLAEFLEDVQFLEARDEKDNTQLSYYESKARTLLARWADQGFLRNALDAEGQVLYELTPESERALQWLDSLEKREFVGTESRFKDIMSRLKELVENSDADPDFRIQSLEAKKRQIEAEIARIKTNESVRAFDDYQIKSRYLEVNRMAQQLLSDFREVEENFRELTREVYQRHMELRGGKGQVLRYAFDALDSLKSSNQGKSFYAFWDFLLVTSGQQELHDLTEQVYHLLEERQIEHGDSFLRHLRSFLHQAAQKVLDSNDRMAQRLSRIIIDKDPAESRQIKETLARIKDLAVRLSESSFSAENYLELELRPQIAMPMERRLSLEPEEPVFLEQPEAEPEDWQDPPEALDYLFNAFYVDKDAVHARIEALLVANPEWSLLDLIQQHPIQQGLPEVFAYLSVAAKKQGIDEQGRMLIPFDYENNRALLMPKVRFKK